MARKGERYSGREAEKPGVTSRRVDLRARPERMLVSANWTLAVTAATRIIRSAHWVAVQSWEIRRERAVRT